MGNTTWIAGWLVASIVLGQETRARRQLVREAEQRAIEAERSHEAESLRRAGEERIAIARELHDILAHRISLINVQAGAGLHLMDRQPEQARAALTAIHGASKEALVELRATLGVLRQVDEREPRTPSPGLAQLDARHRRRSVCGHRGRALDRGRGAGAARWGRFRGLPDRPGVADQCGPACAGGIHTDRDCLPVEGASDRRPGQRERCRTLARHAGQRSPGMRERAAALAATCRLGPWRAAASSSTRVCRSTGRVIRVLLADDQTLVRAGFRAILSAEDDIDVVGEAADGLAAVAIATEQRPEVVLMDIRMPGLDGLEATRRIAGDGRLDGVRVVILTTFETDEYVFDAIRAGASGFLVKDTDPADLLRAVRVVARGDALLTPSVTRRLIADVAARARVGAPIRVSTS